MSHQIDFVTQKSERRGSMGSSGVEWENLLRISATSTPAGILSFFGVSSLIHMALQGTERLRNRTIVTCANPDLKTHTAANLKSLKNQNFAA